MLTGVEARLAGGVVLAAAIIAVLWLAYLWAYGRGVASQQPAIALAEALEQVATAANVENNEQIDALHTRLTECTRTVAADLERATAAAVELRAAQQQAARSAAAALETRNERISHDATLQDWADTRVPAAFVPDLGVR